MIIKSCLQFTWAHSSSNFTCKYTYYWIVIIIKRALLYLFPSTFRNNQFIKVIFYKWLCICYCNPCRTNFHSLVGGDRGPCTDLYLGRLAGPASGPNSEKPYPRALPTVHLPGPISIFLIYPGMTTNQLFMIRISVWFRFRSLRKVTLQKLNKKKGSGGGPTWYR